MIGIGVWMITRKRVGRASPRMVVRLYPVMKNVGLKYSHVGDVSSNLLKKADTHAGMNGRISFWEPRHKTFRQKTAWGGAENGILHRHHHAIARFGLPKSSKTFHVVDERCQVSRGLHVGVEVDAPIVV